MDESTGTCVDDSRIVSFARMFAEAVSEGDFESAYRWFGKAEVVSNMIENAAAAGQLL